MVIVFLLCEDKIVSARYSVYKFKERIFQIGTHVFRIKRGPSLEWWMLVIPKPSKISLFLYSPLQNCQLQIILSIV